MICYQALRWLAWPRCQGPVLCYCLSSSKVISSVQNAQLPVLSYRVNTREKPFVSYISLTSYCIPHKVEVPSQLLPSSGTCDSTRHALLKDIKYFDTCISYLFLRRMAPQRPPTFLTRRLEEQSDMKALMKQQKSKVITSGLAAEVLMTLGCQSLDSTLDCLDSCERLKIELRQFVCFLH